MACSGEKENDGGHRFGNFPQYYDFNPPEQRLEVLFPQISDKIKKNINGNLTILDVGCNEGNLTIEFARLMSNELSKNDSKEHNNEANISESKDVDQSNIFDSKQELLIDVFAIDLDQNLISRTINKPRPEYSSIDFMCQNIMSEEGREEIKNFLSDKGKSSYDLITLFSVTMWIHLHHGDEGLRDLLLFISSITRFLLIEPQPWKCYRNAATRVRRIGLEQLPYYDKLEWRHHIEQDIDRFLEFNCGFNEKIEFGETKWRRKLVLYYKRF